MNGPRPGSPEILQVHHIADNTTAEGFGHRMAVWVQGCANRCPGCMAPDTWDYAGGTPMTVSELIQRLHRSREDIEGITLLGGEPFDQALPLARLAREARQLGLSVITFTGYTLEALRRREDPGIRDLIQATDLLIDGPYLQEQRSFARPWVGSDNQKFRFLSSRYTPDDLQKEHNRIEMRILPDGTLRTNGMTDFPALLESLLCPEAPSGRTEQPEKEGEFS